MNTKRPTVTLTIERINSLGLGVGICDERRIAVPFVLVGETVQARILGRKGDTELAELVEVLVVSPARRLPACAVFGRCGGCQLQHMNYDEQLKVKLGNLQSALRAFPSATIRPVLPSPAEFRYRNRITLHHDSQRFGYYAANSHELIAISECPIAEDAVNVQLGASLLKMHSPVEVRADGQSGDSSFAQVNSAQNVKLIDVIGQMVSGSPGGRGRSILELYAGAGNLSFALTGLAKRILAVEGNEKACQAALRRRQQEVLGRRVTIRHQAAEDAVFELVRDCESFDVIVCDPPRDGLLASLNRLDKLGATQIIYVSCNPLSFARDATALASKGYVLQEVTPLDMFPQTVHLEIVARFSRS